MSLHLVPTVSNIILNKLMLSTENLLNGLSVHKNVLIDPEYILNAYHYSSIIIIINFSNK